MSDRADTALSSQLILLVPSTSISAADWAEMWLNFLPSAFPTSCVCENPLRNSGSARLAGGSLLAEGPEAAPAPFYFCSLFSLIFPAFPGLSLQQSFKLRVVLRFLNTAGKRQKTQVSLDPTFDVRIILKHRRLCLCQGTKIVADFIWVTAPALLSYK